MAPLPRHEVRVRMSGRPALILALDFIQCSSINTNMTCVTFGSCLTITGAILPV